MKNEIAILLADGFEEIEALAPADIWRRLGLTVKLAGVTGKIVTSTRGIPVTADLMISELNADDLQLVYLPGGLPGATNLRDDSRVIELIQKVHADGGFVGAICAAPIVLAKHGLLEGNTFTMYPGFDDYLNGLRPTGNPAESCDRVVTGKGPGAVFAFAEKLSSALGTDLKNLYNGMFVEL